MSSATLTRQWGRMLGPPSLTQITGETYSTTKFLLTCIVFLASSTCCMFSPCEHVLFLAFPTIWLRHYYFRLSVNPFIRLSFSQRGNSNTKIVFQLVNRSNDSLYYDPMYQRTSSVYLFQLLSWYTVISACRLHVVFKDVRMPNLSDSPLLFRKSWLPDCSCYSND